MSKIYNLRLSNVWSYNKVSTDDLRYSLYLIFAAKTMKNLVFLIVSLSFYIQAFSQPSASDSNLVIKLNKIGYEQRLINPLITLKNSEKALKIATSLNYNDGIAEAYRVKGIGQYYNNRSDRAIDSYLISLSYYRKTQNLTGQAKVYNNIGNLYRNVDFDKGLEYFKKSLSLATRLEIRDLIAGLYLNIGSIYQNKSLFNEALLNYNRSKDLFISQKHLVGVTQCLQNIGGIYLSLNKLEEAEKILKQAILMAKKNKLNYIVGSANLVLTSVYIAQDRFKESETAISEGMNYAKLINDNRLTYDYLYKSYQLESKRHNYSKALANLRQIYAKDSIAFQNNESVKIDLLQEQHKQLEQQRENELTIAQQKYSKTLFWAITIVAGLSLVVIFLLIRNVRKSAKTNKQLTNLNQEVSAQKENLNRINSDLENIIDVRTKDLKIKNNKLSEYSSHLSHQIRSPISSLKGLMMLEKDQLIDHEEFIMQVEKCIEDIDTKIININEMLNDPSRFTLKSGQE